MNTTVDIQRITTSTDMALVRNVAELYCQIWSEPPWDEGGKWTPEGVVSDIMRDLANDHAEGFIALSGGEVVGFTWGYEITPTKLVEIASTTTIKYVFRAAAPDNPPAIRMFYIDELGVASSVRGGRVGRQLSSELIAAAIQRHDLRHFILRTDKDAHPARTLYSKLGFSELTDVHDGAYADRSYWILDTTLSAHPDAPWRLVHAKTAA